MHPTIARQLVAELLGTTALAATVIGSGIMAVELTGGNAPALALLANAVATSAVLVALILGQQAVSGAHFNPAVSMVAVMRGNLSRGQLAARTLVQLGGAWAGVLVAHAMFGLPLLQRSVRIRSGPAQWLSEIVATFGLVVTIETCGRHRADAVPAAVGLYVLAAYWFTSSTAFANPALTVARAASDTFAGIRPDDVPAFVTAQVLGALAAAAVVGWLLRREGE